MEFKQITFKRIKNLGNYEAEHCEVHAQLDEGDDFQDSFRLLKAQVQKALNITPYLTNDELDELEVF